VSEQGPGRAPADSLGRGSLVNLAGAGASAASTLLVVVLTARILSPADAGRVFALTSAFLIAAAVLRGGTATGVVLFVSRAADPTGAVARRIGRRGVRPVLLASTTVAVLGAIGSAPLGAALGVSTATVLVLVASLPAAAVLDTVLAVSRGHHDMVPTVAVDRIGRPVLQLALAGLVALDPGVTGMVAAWCVPYVVAAAAAWTITPALHDRHADQAAGPPEEAREFRGFVVARGAAAVIQICFARLDIVLVAALAGPREAAIYTAATRFVTVCQLVQQAVATAGEPALARTIARGELDVALSIYRTTTVWLLSLLWPVLLIAAAVAPEWLAVFGPAYRDGVGVVLVLTAAMLVATGVGMVETVLNMAGRSATLVLNNVGALVTMVGLDLALVPTLGALGAALGWAAAIVVKNVVPLVQLRATLPGLPFSRSWVLGAALDLGLLGALPVLGGLTLGAPGRWTGLALGVALLLPSYVMRRSDLRLDRLFLRAPMLSGPAREARC
jgi:O-antigen/teichoic acid export membrane protein